ncbi:NUDIX hydrolase [Patescibacteria group bacterium]|nr:NUDIX hydrolase [Patescibacteria group bacterium]MBU1500830.1 NUDIX hydrolase [Patescibacteria group bacterium]MBU2080885.1 NUDIX hydrolase [Patescibacteria group bacterium]MBU2123990.1 NUDIX hydrolase [Patescibacteria group bacterium]MBU2194719.1 NUDIX hydrolase [Patescibacteria group bacterium]
MHIGKEIGGPFDAHKALILPLNPEGKIYIQDRRGHKKPDWGYFGGGMEKDETPVETVIRESCEELTIEISENDLQYLGISETDWDGKKIIRYMYLYQTDRKEFDVREGKGGHWLTLPEIRERLDDKDRFDEVALRIQEVLRK